MSYQKMRAGVLDRRIRLWRNVETMDRNGAVIATQAEIGDGWFAARSILNSVESATPGKINARQMVMFTMRYRADLRANDFIEFENEFYDIIGIEEMERRKGIVVKAIKR